MPLKNVAAKLRKSNWPTGLTRKQVANLVIDRFEADPDFTLRDRVEAMAADLERPYAPGLDQPTGAGIARRLRNVLEGKRPPW